MSLHYDHLVFFFFFIQTTAQCFDLILAPCLEGLPYNQVQFPNEFAYNQGEVIGNYYYLREVFETCHPNGLEQICRFNMPECEPVKNLPQCRDVCESVRNSCNEPFMEASGGFEWPTCDRLPYVNCTDSEGGKISMNMLNSFKDMLRC